MSRSAPRVRARLATTVRPTMGDELFVCHTRDISSVGFFLETASAFDPGVQLVASVMDPHRGIAIEVIGEVTRCLPYADGLMYGIGVHLIEPPPEWGELVQLKSQASAPIDKRTSRLRILVVGDDARQRGALALYVTSGWDVRFATDLSGAVEALGSVKLSAIISEHDLDDTRWEPILAAARDSQPEARRIVRGAASTNGGDGRPPLYHRFVDRNAGMDALLDALTADIGNLSGAGAA